MTIRVAPRAADLAADLAGRFVVLVRRADDTDAALRGLDAARRRLVSLDRSGDPRAVSPVVLSPDGPLLRVGDVDLDEEALHDLPAAIADALAAAGVASARVDVVEPRGPLDELDRASGAAVLRAFPFPAGADAALPPQWLDLAAEFVLGDAAASEQVSVRLLGAPSTVAASGAVATLHAANAAGAWCDVVRGDLRRRLRSASVTYGRAPHLALAAGGPQCDVPALVARFELLCELARELRPDVAYVCVDLEPDFGAVGSGLSTAGWRAHGGASPNAVAATVGDIAVPDAYPYQVLGPGHLARRRGRARLGTALEGGRAGVALGDPVDWLARYGERDAVLAKGWKALAGLLLTDRELAELVLQRSPATPRREAPNGLRAGPDLDDVVLDPVPHPRRGLRLTLLELAAWLAHEPHTDAPTTVSPVLAAYGRWLASGLDDERRQDLKPTAARLVGTHDPALADEVWRPLASVDDARAWSAADALARTQAAAWLRAAGLEAQAEAIARVRPRKDRGHLAKLDGLLASAIDELGALERPGRHDGVDRAWDHWERASEASGWVAASEAAWVGVPERVAADAELVVIELARSPHTAPDPKDDGRTLVAAARAAALASAAQSAWDDALRRAAAVVDDTARDEVHDISLRAALDRSRAAAGRRLGLDRDAVDQALEQAEAAARAELGRLVLEPTVVRGSALDSARRAAAASAGGTVWSEVQTLSQGVVGEDAWEAALAAGRVAVDRVLQTAAGLVERAVVVALAREACGLAARTVIERDGPAAVDEVVRELQDAAVALFDALLDAPDPSRPRRRRPRAAVSG